jgi:hypothetical protein
LERKQGQVNQSLLCGDVKVNHFELYVDKRIFNPAILPPSLVIFMPWFSSKPNQEIPPLWRTKQYLGLQLGLLHLAYNSKYFLALDSLPYI